MLIMIVTFLLLTVMLYGIARIALLGSFSDLEAYYTRQNVERVSNALDEDLADLSRMTHDWAAWDDSYLFVEDRNEAYIQSNLVGSLFPANRLSLFVYWHESGEIVWSGAFDLQEEESQPVPQELVARLMDGSLLRLADARGHLHGILLLPQGPMLVAIEPIVNSEETEPARGSLIMGRYLDEAEVAHLAEATYTDLTLARLEQAEILPDFHAALMELSEEAPIFVQPLTTETIMGYTLVRDLYDEPALVLRVAMERDIYRQGQAAVNSLLFLLAAAGFVVILVTMLVLQRLIIRRVESLGQSVGRITESGTLSLRLPVSGQDELSKLAEDINEMLVTLDQSITALGQQLGRVNLLNQITSAIAERQDLSSIFRVLVRRLEDHFPVDFAYVYLLDPESHVLTLGALGPKSTRIAKQAALLEATHIPLAASGVEACARGEVVYIPDLAEGQTEFFHQLYDLGSRSLLALPLMATNHVLGILLAARSEVDSFGTTEREFLLGLSQHVSLAVRQARLYRDLQNAYDELHQAQQAVMRQERLRALGQMASGIAHDINNALTPAVIYVSMLLRDSDLSPAAQRQLQAVYTACNDVVQTVSRMREFYRKRADDDTLYSIDLNKIVLQVLDLTRPRWKDMLHESGRVIDLQTELKEDLLPILGVESEIREALTNLIFNAVDAMPDGGILTLRTSTRLLGASLEAQPEQVTAVVLEVVDTGVGMNQEMREHCFEPFFSTKGAEGTGLGLSMVYGIMQRHGGSIEVDSVPRQGTTMRLCFPVINGLPVGEEELDLAGTVPALRILCIDDNPVLLHSLKELLESEGHTIVTAEVGQDGMQRFVEARAGDRPFHAVITDLGMPYMDGRQVAQAVKNESPETAVILLTGWGESLKAEHDIPAGVDYLVSKPPQIQALRKVLAKVAKKVLASAAPDAETLE